MSASVARAIRELGYTEAFSVNEEPNVSSIVWQGSETGRPTIAQIEAKLVELNAALPMKILRDERNRRLQECDWTQGDDVPTAIKSAWTTYRQALRDITDTYTSLDTVVWPTKP